MHSNYVQRVYIMVKPLKKTTKKSKPKKKGSCSKEKVPGKPSLIEKENQKENQKETSSGFAITPLPPLSDQQLENLISDIKNNNEASSLWPTTEEFVQCEIDEARCMEDIVVAKEKMDSVENKSMDDVLGDGNHSTPSLLSHILNPDSGGKGFNKDGLGGILAMGQPELSPAEKMKRRQRALYKQRQSITKDDYVYDARGKKIVGARKVTLEQMQSGLAPRGQRQNIDKDATKKAIKENLLKLKQERLNKA